MGYNELCRAVSEFPGVRRKASEMLKIQYIRKNCMPWTNENRAHKAGKETNCSVPLCGGHHVLGWVVTELICKTVK